MLRLSSLLLLGSLFLPGSPAAQKKTDIEALIQAAVFLKAFEGSGIDGMQAIAINDQVKALKKERLNSDFVFEAAGIERGKFYFFLEHSRNTLRLIGAAVPIRKALTALDIALAKGDKEYPPNHIYMLLYSLEETGQKPSYSSVATALQQSKALFKTGYPSFAPFTAVGIDLEAIPDASLNYLVEYLHKEKGRGEVESLEEAILEGFI